MHAAFHAPKGLLGFEGHVGSDGCRGPDLHREHGVGREVYGAGEGYFAAAKGSAQVANDFCDRCAGVGRSHVGVGNHRELRALKAKEVVCVRAGLEGYREPWQRSGDGTGNLLNVVKIKRVSASIGEGLGHNN